MEANVSEEKWAKNIKKALSEGFEVLESGSILIDSTEFMKSLAYDGCYPGRLRSAQQALSPKKEVTVQDAVRDAVSKGGGQVDVESAVLFALLGFFIDKKLGIGPSQVKEEHFSRIPPADFEAFVRETIQKGLVVRGARFDLSDATLSSFMKFDYPVP